MTTYAGPTSMRCPQSCDVPAGVRLAVVPPPRHNWGDVVHCPNDDCGRALLVLEDGKDERPEVIGHA